ncbi:hypothetical protein Fmac_013506 [Flemingia macrophylla]|uniref:CW-type domain-containing protein n=1 Tax=Flemingia macrophylla TaxID=520843 RepID=A0ABD1MTB3_9FABA
MKKVLDHKMEISQNNNFTDPKNNSKCKAFAISKRAKCDEVKCKVDQDTQVHETNQKGKIKSESKNESKGEQSSGKVMTAAEKDSIVTSSNAMVNVRKSNGIGVISSKSKMHKIKSLKDNKVRDLDRYPSKGKKSERIVDGVDPTDGSPLNKTTGNANLDHVEKSAYRAKVKERPIGIKVANQLSAGPCVKHAPGAFPIAENKPTSDTVPPSSAAAPQVIEEDWVCCDRCQKWRLLPMGLKPEQLPDKWLCSMLDWLPGMNRCNISEEETTKALYASYLMPIPEGQNNMQSHATRPETGVISVDAVQLGLNHKKSSSAVMLDLGKKKKGMSETAKSGIINDMHQLLNAEKKNAKESLKNINLNGMNQWPADSNHMKQTNFKHLIKEKNIAKAKEKQRNGGDGNIARLKRKMEDNQHGSGTLKKSKTEDVCNADKHLNSGTELKNSGLNSRNGLSTMPTRKSMRKYDNYCCSDNQKEKLVDPHNKGDWAKFSSDDGSLDAINSSKSGSKKKRKISDWLDNEKNNKTLSLKGHMKCGKEGNVNLKEKYIVLNMEAKSVTESDDKLNRKTGMKQVFLSDSSDKMAVGAELKGANKVQQHRKHKISVASYCALDYFDPLSRDLGSGQFSLAATSSSSKVSGSHRARTNLEEVRGSPVESVTSSPLRTSNMDNRILAAGDTSEKDDDRKVGLSVKSLDNREGKLSVKMKERISYDIHPAHGNCSSGSLHEENLNKSNQENALSWQKSGKVTSLRIKEKDRNSGYKVSRNKMTVSASNNDFSQKGANYESAVDPSHHSFGTETRNDAESSSLKSKYKIDNLTKKNSSRHLSNETGKLTEVKQKVDDRTNRKIISQQNLIQNLEEENKANPVCTGSRDGKAKVISSSDGKVKRETFYVGSRTAPELQKGDMSDGHPVHASGHGGDVPTFVRNPVDVRDKVGVNLSSGSLVPDGQFTESSPVTTNSSQTASSILEEATKLKDSADHYKNSGFEFESNETYFKAALKFLHGASLLENSHNESSKYGEMSQIQIYATTVKLFESCAHKYERSQEMAAAALAYKCMEVVYMRLVNCKHSSINRDRHELQSTLQMVSQGESPSSSASDIDNLNNLAVVDKATLTRCSNTHVAKNQVISAQNFPNIVRLLDFTQEVSFAMEASRKCQSTFMAASSNMGGACNTDCITSIRKVVHFSFQDVDKLVRLVLNATKAITRAGLGGVRD